MAVRSAIAALASWVSASSAVDSGATKFAYPLDLEVVLDSWRS